MTAMPTTPNKRTEVHGQVTVTVNLELRDCVLQVDANGQRMKTFRFHSVEQIETAYAKHASGSSTSTILRDLMTALKFAASEIRSAENRRV